MHDVNECVESVWWFGGTSHDTITSDDRRVYIACLKYFRTGLVTEVIKKLFHPILIYKMHYQSFQSIIYFNAFFIKVKTIGLFRTKETLI